MDELISVVIPTFNRAHLIRRAINSALSQIVEGDEIIVIDDGSTDDTEGVIGKYGDQIRYVRTNNKGAGAARNRGTKEARNPFIAFLDSDDEWLEGKIEIQRKIMKARPDILFCFSDFGIKESEERGGQENELGVKTWSNDCRSWEDIFGPGELYSNTVGLPEGESDFYCYCGNIYTIELTANYVNVNTMMVRREKAGEALYFAEDVKTYEDWECFGRLARAGKCGFLDCKLAWQHGHEGPRLTDAHITDCALERIKIIERIWGLDDEFLKKNGDLYKKILEEQRRIRAVGLLVRGDVKEAKQEFKKMESPPIIEYLLANLPEQVVKKILKLRSYIKKY